MPQKMTFSWAVEIQGGRLHPLEPEKSFYHTGTYMSRNQAKEIEAKSLIKTSCRK